MWIVLDSLENSYLYHLILRQVPFRWHYCGPGKQNKTKYSTLKAQSVFKLWSQHSCDLRQIILLCQHSLPFLLIRINNKNTKHTTERQCRPNETMSAKVPSKGLGCKYSVSIPPHSQIENSGEEILVHAAAVWNWNIVNEAFLYLLYKR